MWMTIAFSSTLIVLSGFLMRSHVRSRRQRALSDDSGGEQRHRLEQLQFSFRDVLQRNDWARWRRSVGQHLHG